MLLLLAPPIWKPFSATYLKSGNRVNRVIRAFVNVDSEEKVPYGKRRMDDPEARELKGLKRKSFRLEPSSDGNFGFQLTDSTK